MLSFVHISDLHIGQDGPFAIDRDADPREEMIEDLGRITPQIDGDISGILISGDIAHAGASDEYDRASEWLARLCECVGTAEENVWCVPGNHDFDREVKPRVWDFQCNALRNCSLEEIDPLLGSYLDSPLDREVLLEPLTNYHEFAARFECVPEGPIQTWNQEFQLNDHLRLRVVGLNTAILAEGHEDRNGDGLVLGERAMQIRRGGDNFFVLAMWHHPLMWLRDGVRASDYLSHRASVHIFGHEHDHHLEGTNTLLSISAGALHPRRGTQDWDPRYNVLQLSPRGTQVSDGLDINVFPRVWDQATTTFGGHRTVAELDSESFFICESQEFAASEPSAPQGNGQSDLEPAPVNAENDSYDSSVDPPPGRVTSRRRRLSLQYARLPFVRRIVIAGDLGLLSDRDSEVTGFEQTRLVIKRAAEEGRLDELWDAVAREH